MDASEKACERERRLLHSVIESLGRRWSLVPSQVSVIAQRSRMSSAPRGALVASRGIRLPGLTIVGCGTLKLLLRRADGEERVVRLVHAGQAFGESASLLGRPCPYYARALTECKLVVIPAAVVLGLMELDGRFARRIALMLAERNFELLSELESATTQRGAERLATYLESLAGEKAHGGTTVNLPMSKTLVAARLGIKKETLSRLLRQFIADGVIAVEQREIAILDRARLTGLAHARSALAEAEAG